MMESAYYGANLFYMIVMVGAVLLTMIFMALVSVLKVIINLFR